MEAIWNRMQLERPPNATCYLAREKFDVTGFLAVLENVIKDLNSQELLHKEAAVLGRLIYRMKSKFRNDKGVKAMSKVNKALLKYLVLSLEKEYENLKIYVELEGNNIKLPTRQMIEYVLIRTQGFAKLMLRVETVAKHSAHFLKSRIGLGHAWGIAIIAYAVVSRIWILSRHLIKMSCTWYNNLYKYLKFFKTIGLKWLPNDYELPNNLEAFLALSWIHEPTPSVPSSHGLNNTIFKLIIPHEYNSVEDLALNVQDDNEEKTDIISDDDTGEIIHRDSFIITKKKLIENVGINQSKTFMKETPKLPKNKSQHKLLTFDNVKNKEDLTILLNKKAYPGLDKLQWNMVRNKSKKLLNKLDVCQDETKQLALLKKIIKRIKQWIT
ncbi:nucleolus and neural progenitor protein [Calliopsis andreniformis]|uniref:nucleolus and neural progenitor protein n=1 Tax=Calliopsis andreniformis TaxID=337506 RepID=UPI003FCE3769